MGKFKPSTNHILIVVAAGLYLYAQFEGGSLPYFLFRTLAGILIIAWLWTGRIFSRIDYGTELEADRSQVGQSFPLHIALLNRSRFYIPWLEVVADIPADFQLEYGRMGQVFSVAASEQRTLDFMVKCNRRGYYQVGAATVRLGDVFGIFVRERLLKANRTLIVYPKIIPLERLNVPSLRHMGSAITLKATTEDLTGPSGVRKYAYGDPLNKIHWRATARTGQLQVKEYDLHTVPELGIFLDLSARGYRSEEVLECGITVAASIANFCSKRRLRYGLVTNGKNLFIQPASRDAGQLLRTMEHLALADTGKSYPFAKTVLLESRNFVQGNTLLLITPEIDEELVGILGVLGKRGYSLAVAQVGKAVETVEFPFAITYFSGITEEKLPSILGGDARERQNPRIG